MSCLAEELGDTILQKLAYIVVGEINATHLRSFLDFNINQEVQDMGACLKAEAVSAEIQELQFGVISLEHDCSQQLASNFISKFVIRKVQRYQACSIENKTRERLMKRRRVKVIRGQIQMLQR